MRDKQRRTETKSRLKKVVQWSVEETKCLVGSLASPCFRRDLKVEPAKTKLLAELRDKLLKAEFTKTPGRIIINFKKCIAH